MPSLLLRRLGALCHYKSSEMTLPKWTLTQSSMRQIHLFLAAVAWMAVSIGRPDRNCLRNAGLCIGCETGAQKLQRDIGCPVTMNSHGWSRVAGRQAAGTETSGILLSDVTELGRGIWLSVCCLSLISSGIYGYPKDQALKVAVDNHQCFSAGT